MDDVLLAGENPFVSLYCGKYGDTVDRLRYQRYYDWGTCHQGLTATASKFATDIGSGALPQLKGVPAGETEACKVKGKACQLKIGDGGFPVTK